MEMIPALVKAGYEYLVVDGVHVRPEDGVNDIYRPYLACRDGFCITVVPRDRVISNAQESGLDPQWFARESLDRTRGSPRPSDPRLVTSWSDGENGGWFRQTHEASGFFGHFFSPYMEEVRLSEFPVIPVGLSDYLKRNPPSARAEVQTGAWNVGSTSGCDFTQWAGSERQKKADRQAQLVSLRDVSVGPPIAAPIGLIWRGRVNGALLGLVHIQATPPPQAARNQSWRESADP